MSELWYIDIVLLGKLDLGTQTLRCASLQVRKDLRTLEFLYGGVGYDYLVHCFYCTSTHCPNHFWYIESVWNYESESQVEDLLAYRSFIQYSVPVSPGTM
jgi:hypothetical protein